MAVPLVVGLTDTGPNAPHEFIVVRLAIVEPSVDFAERIGLLTNNDKKTFGGQTRDDGPLIIASRKVAGWAVAHV